MELSDKIIDHKDKILSIWIDRTLESYNSSGFFKKSKDHFANPIGGNIKDGLAKVLDLLFKQAQADILEYKSALDQIIRIRAIQDFTPSQAVVPFLELKWVIRQVISDDKNMPTNLDLSELDCEIDRVALAAFDIYTECRERLYQVRIKELKSGSYILTDTPCSSKMLKKKAGPSKIN